MTQSKKTSLRVQAHSALDALMDGPQAQAWGAAERLHNVVTRYVLLLSLPNGHAARYAAQIVAWMRDNHVQRPATGGLVVWRLIFAAAVAGYQPEAPPWGVLADTALIEAVEDLLAQAELEAGK